jgi:sulfur dioxygenase
LAQAIEVKRQKKRWNPWFSGQIRSECIEFMANQHLPDPKKMMEVVPAYEYCGNILAVAV